jgi:hypothetical protein
MPWCLSPSSSTAFTLANSLYITEEHGGILVEPGKERKMLVGTRQMWSCIVAQC